jgi:hypothetical protein
MGMPGLIVVSISWSVLRFKLQDKPKVPKSIRNLPTFSFCQVGVKAMVFQAVPGPEAGALH